MSKKLLAPANILFPLPAALISVATPDKRPNIITLSWVGMVNSIPPMLGIAIRPGRHSHPMVKEAGDFVVNVATDKMLEVVDRCGTVSGRDVDKFAQFGLHPAPSEKVKSPGIAECPVNVECVVRQTIPLGSHDLFLAEIVAVRADEEVLSDRGRVDVSKVAPLAYCPGDGRYFGMGDPLALYGYSAKQR